MLWDMPPSQLVPKRPRNTAWRCRQDQLLRMALAILAIARLVTSPLDLALAPLALPPLELALATLLSNQSLILLVALATHTPQTRPGYTIGAEISQRCTLRR